jgi:hypothetical protein
MTARRLAGRIAKEAKSCGCRGFFSWFVFAVKSFRVEM